MVSANNEFNYFNDDNDDDDDNDHDDDGDVREGGLRTYPLWSERGLSQTSALSQHLNKR